MPRLKLLGKAGAKNIAMTRREIVAENRTPPTPTDTRPPFTPAQLADRWKWHPESVRRALRERRMASIIISRRRLIPASEIDRVESEGFISRAA